MVAGGGGASVEAVAAGAPAAESRAAKARRWSLGEAAFDARRECACEEVGDNAAPGWRGGAGGMMGGARSPCLDAHVAHHFVPRAVAVPRAFQTTPR